jgi:hypothetical protein
VKGWVTLQEWLTLFSAIGNRQSAIGNRQSAIGNRQSAEFLAAQGRKQT